MDTRLLALILFFSWYSVCPGLVSAGKPDTTYSISFQLNMSKAVQEQIFDPDSDYLYLVMDHGIDSMRLVPGPDYNYSCMLYNEFDSGVTYHYKFRINSDQWEIVNRSITAQPGIVYVKAWWNNEALNYTRFIVNMKYAVQAGKFNPVTDSVCIVGTMNDSLGSRMNQIDTTFQYSITYSFDPGSVQQYKYRINEDSSGFELAGHPNRMIRIQDTLLQINNDFDNYNPAKCPMTFLCKMNYYVEAHHFDPNVDFLDVAGNFNDWGANDVLFDRLGDTAFTLEKFIDTTWFSQGPLEFKFRINGDWDASELHGKPNRNYAFHDTVNFNPNLFSCYYNNLNPNIPTPPWVYDVSIQGSLIHKEILSGMYTYEDVNGIPEDSTTYQWYRCADSLGIDRMPIDSAWEIIYTVDTLDIGMWLAFEVTPRAAYGDSAVGKTVMVISGSRIGGVGIDELTGLMVKVYPNPANDYIILESREVPEKVELLNQSGQLMLVVSHPDSKAIRIQTGHLARGFYFLKVSANGYRSGVIRFIKQ
ncbi:MAG: T9SS type A sorting domain-containing protein [Bacteroidales bacterium]|nr:T9SS type A sorting domain-containing protein [Bacteroidales bacterium]MDD4604205.1 T9SS type A sorting domain-containing protein [Bacteroidales bacterium]